jgi:hypothetical protein
MHIHIDAPIASFWQSPFLISSTFTIHRPGLDLLQRLRPETLILCLSSFREVVYFTPIYLLHFHA